MNYRQKLVLKLARACWRWDDTYGEKRVLGVTLPYAPEWGFIRTICKILRTHVVVNDHCGYPSHRYCAACGTPTPDQELSS